MGALKAVVAILGVSIVAVAGLIGIELYQRPGKAAPPAPKAGGQGIVLPKDAAVLETTAAGDRLVLRLGLPNGGQRLLIFDLTRGGALAGTVELERAP